MRASAVLATGYGWCVTKAALLAAAARAAGIPARLGFADVRNHLSTERMRATMATDVFVWHGYTELWLQGAWRKATPAFNVELCERFGLLPLEFDGRNDSSPGKRAKAEPSRQAGDYRPHQLATTRCRPSRGYGRASLRSPECPGRTRHLRCACSRC